MPVGIFDKLAGWLAPGTADTGAAAGVTGTSAGAGYRSPWATGRLSKIALADIFGLEHLPVTRAEAMAIPAIARARHILTSDAARCPLEVLEGTNALPGEGLWLQSTKLTTSPQHRAVWTTDDLIHYGWSLWVVERDADGVIQDGARCPIEWWRFGVDGGILINDAPAEADAVILIPGFHEGIINSAQHTIRGSRLLEETWQDRAANPIPATELHQTTPDNMTALEVDELVDGWTVALRNRGGAVGWTPSSIDVRTHGEAATDLLIQGRNAAAVDAARVVGVPAAMIDASNVNASLTYETLEGRGGEYVDRSLPLYLGPIEARLSLDDVTRPGTRVRANTSALTNAAPAPTGTPTGD